MMMDDTMPPAEDDMNNDTGTSTDMPETETGDTGGETPEQPGQL